MPKEISESKTTIPKITKRMYDFLLWAHAHSPISLIPAEWSIMWKKARDEKFLEECGREPGQMGFTRYRLSELGRAAINV